MPKIFISTGPFGEFDPKPPELLRETDWKIDINPLGRKLKPTEVAELVLDYGGLIAGTEDLSILINRVTITH